MKKLEYIKMVNTHYGMIYGGTIGKMHDVSRRVYKTDYISPSIHTMGGGNTETKIIEKGSQMLRVRKLTPKECWRLMGFADEDIDRCIEAGLSNTQLYKQAGNSIVVDVLEGILKNLLKEA